MVVLKRAVLVCGMAAVVGVPGAHADLGTDIARSCMSDWFLPRAVCVCVAEQAVARFSEAQLSWLALPAGDPARAAALAKELSMSEAQAVTGFMVSAPQQCGAP
ncbi:MAG TPA: hypothetical protein VMW31_01635 [Devosiaceae bacterium]|nr:hypothetical protein [Devosiaceae bacterium]